MVIEILLNLTKRKKWGCPDWILWPGKFGDDCEINALKFGRNTCSEI